ncbi:MAG: protein involved in aromatic compounds catabolism [Rhodospirillales bacterium]|jgi:uncharacterized protein (TIGR00369 family)|nr:protein involved in aromatic compounds catabolism [Rhodospirillales bacterium]
MSLIPESELSGYARLIGYRLSRWEPDFAEIVLELGSQHENRGGIAHGGVLATLIDTACGFAGCWAPPGQTRAAVTLSLTTQFLAPAKSGRLIATGRRVGGGRSIFFATAEVRDAEGTLLARGEGVFRYRESANRP